MDKKRVDRWVWMLIYGGMLAFSLGWFVQPGGVALGTSLIAGGGLVAAVGVALIFLRARMGP